MDPSSEKAADAVEGLIAGLSIDDASVPAESETPKWLYVDGLNYAREQFYTSPNHFAGVEAGEKAVARFCKAATTAGFRIKVFQDASIPTPEAQQKWTSRREREVRRASRDVPHGLNVLLGDAFRACGVEVMYSVSHDNDDTLAAYAQADGAAVLSRDRDFFRYRDTSYTVYDNFDIKKGKLVLSASGKNTPQPGTELRDLPVPLPITTSTDHPSLVTVLHSPDPALALYRRGTPSALTKYLGNLHVPVRPLRRALYLQLARAGRLGADTVIRESMPEWDAAGGDGAGAVVWQEADIAVRQLEEEAQAPDSKLTEMLRLLEAPHEALEAMLPQPWPTKPKEAKQADWVNHVYAMHAVVYEVCCMASPSTLTLAPLLKAAAAKRPEAAVKLPARTAGGGGAGHNGHNGNGHGNSHSEGPPAHSFACRDCGAKTHMSGPEVSYYEERQLTLPARCKACRALRKQQQATGGAGGAAAAGMTGQGMVGMAGQGQRGMVAAGYGGAQWQQGQPQAVMVMGPQQPGQQQQWHVQGYMPGYYGGGYSQIVDPQQQQQQQQQAYGQAYGMPQAGGQWQAVQGYYAFPGQQYAMYPQQQQFQQQGQGQLQYQQQQQQGQGGRGRGRGGRGRGEGRGQGRGGEARAESVAAASVDVAH